MFTKRLYHISAIKNRKTIIENGLKPNIGERAKRFGQLEDRIYLTDKLWKLLNLIKSTMWNTHPDFQEGFDVYEIQDDVEVHNDERFEYGLYTRSEIKNLKLVTTLENKN